MIDVEELICELHHIAGTESVDADIRRTACDAESALALLRAWVNELQMNVAEREAVEWCRDNITAMAHPSSAFAHVHASSLRGYLARCATAGR